jgi:hypothetical protein
MNVANGVKGTDTPHATARASTSAYSATEQGIKSNYVASRIKGAEQGEYAAFPTTT